MNTAKRCSFHVYIPTGALDGTWFTRLSPSLSHWATAHFFALIIAHWTGTLPSAVTQEANIFPHIYALSCNNSKLNYITTWWVKTHVFQVAACNLQDIDNNTFQARLRIHLHCRLLDFLRIRLYPRKYTQFRPIENLYCKNT